MIKIFIRRYHSYIILAVLVILILFYFMEGQKRLLCPSNFNDDHFEKDQFKTQKPCIVIK